MDTTARANRSHVSDLTEGGVLNDRQFDAADPNSTHVSNLTKVGGGRSVNRTSSAPSYPPWGMDYPPSTSSKSPEFSLPELGSKLEESFVAQTSASDLLLIHSKVVVVPLTQHLPPSTWLALA